jgi:hypothetical protein
MTTKERLKFDKIERRRKTRKKIREEKKCAILLIIVVTLFGVSIYNKTHTKRECVITDIQGDTITVKHPNNLEYSFKTKEYKEGDIVTVSVDELTDWEKNYKINSIQ